MNKNYILLTLHHFEQLKHKKLQGEFMKITKLRRSSIYKNLKYLDENINGTSELN